ncbi:MAG TPA: hypothetical protein VLH77_05425, partial [Gammaproteobacteria bacterium]|nr:hypothetical protein [Gammaproteobacteria bacterium]
AERQIKVTKNHWDIQLALELKKTTEKVKEQKNEELAALQIEFSNEKKALAEEREAKKTEAQKKHQTLSYQLYWDNLNSRINLLENFIQKVTEEKQSRGFFYGRLNQLSSPEVAAYRQQFNEDFLPGYFIVGSSTGVMTAIAIEALAETAADTALANGTSASAAYNAVWASILGSSPALSCILIIAAGILAGLLIFLCVRELSMRLNFKKGPERFDSHQIGFFSKKALQKAKEISVTCGPYDAHLSRELGLQTIENKTVATVMNLVSTEKERLCSERDRLKFFHSPAQQPREAGEVKDAPDSPTLVGGLGFD